jgi:hypothetical protein
MKLSISLYNLHHSKVFELRQSNWMIESGTRIATFMVFKYTQITDSFPMIKSIQILNFLEIHLKVGCFDFKQLNDLLKVMN